MSDAVAAVTIEGRGPNALNRAAVAALAKALDEAEATDGVEALVLTGKPGGPFSVGLDNAELADPETANTLLGAMGALLLQLYRSPLKIVAKVEGHAVAAGAMLLLVSDVRIGGPGDYRIGFSEVGIGMPLPSLPLVLARDRLNPAWLTRATALSELFSPVEARQAGFLDHVSENLDRDVTSAAARIAALPGPAYRETVLALRQAAIERMERAIRDR